MIWCEESWRDALDRVCENRVFYGMIDKKKSFYKWKVRQTGIAREWKMETYRDLLSQIHTNCKNIPFHKKLSAYNIFDVLEIQSREVIMCRFLTDLLNPEGMHGCGIRFLKSFIRDVLKMDPVSDTLLLHTEVVKE